MRKTMKGIVPVGGYQVEVRELPMPEPAEGEVLIDVKCAGICGSDVNTFRMTWEQIGERQNLVVGHEAGGIVVKTGPNVRKVKEGDRVCVYHYMGCGRCKYCEAGVVGMCENKRAYGWHVHGAMSEFLVAEERSCRVLPAELRFEEAAFLACSAGTAFASLNKLPGSGNSFLAVAGLGPIGMVSSMIAGKQGRRVIAFDPSKNRVDFIRERGVNAFVPEQGTPLARQIQARMNGRRPAAVLDTTGHPEGFADCLEIAENKAKIVTIGKGKRAYAMSGRVNISEIVTRELTIQGSWVFTVPDYEELVELMLDRDLSFFPIVTGRFSFQDGQAAFERAADLQNAGKTVFVKD